MEADTSWRRIVFTAATMVLAAQILAIANDVYLRQRDPSDVVLLGLLIVLTFFLLRGSSWARWTMVALAGLGGVLTLAGFILLVVAKISPEVANSVPASLSVPLTAFVVSPAYLVLASSVLISGALDTVATGMLAFAPSIRIGFRKAEARADFHLHALH